MNFKEIHCAENYSQFDGEFFVWVYLSTDNRLVPEYWRFFLPDGRVIEARVRCTFTNRQAEGDNRGADALRGTSTAEFLLSMFATKDHRYSTNSGWQDRMIAQIKKNYENEPDLFEPPQTPFGNMATNKPQATIADNGFFTVMIMTKYLEVSASDEETDGN